MKDATTTTKIYRSDHRKLRVYAAQTDRTHQQLLHIAIALLLAKERAARAEARQ